MDTLSRKKQNLKCGTIKQLTFLIWHLVFFRRVLCFVGFAVPFLTFWTSEHKKCKKQYVLYENCDASKAQNARNTTLAESFYS